MTLLEQFLAQECTVFVRDLVSAALEAGRAGTGPRRRCLEFNRFEITIDLDEDSVVIEDVLDVTKAGRQCVPLPAFSDAIALHEP
jgi:ethanolamine utilization protein EutQ (cupin superfamily)